jgi:hypothetical protein
MSLPCANEPKTRRELIRCPRDTDGAVSDGVELQRVNTLDSAVAMAVAFQDVVAFSEWTRAWSGERRASRLLLWGSSRSLRPRRTDRERNEPCTARAPTIWSSPLTAHARIARVREQRHARRSEA